MNIAAVSDYLPSWFIGLFEVRLMLIKQKVQQFRSAFVLVEAKAKKDIF